MLTWAGQAFVVPRELEGTKEFGWIQGSLEVVGVYSLFDGSPLSLFQRLAIFISGAGTNLGSWPCPAGAWQRLARPLQGKVRVSSMRVSVSPDSWPRAGLRPHGVQKGHMTTWDPRPRCRTLGP